jgi:hypothetical protein
MGFVMSVLLIKASQTLPDPDLSLVNAALGLATCFPSVFIIQGVGPLEELSGNLTRNCQLCDREKKETFSLPLTLDFSDALEDEMSPTTARPDER